MRWKTHFFFNQDLNTNTTLKEKYVFKTTKGPTQHKDVDDFDK